MTRPGPKPKPVELKALEGNPGRRPLGDKARGAIPAAIPDPPSTLGVEGRKAWALYWKHGRAWLALTDVPILTQLCEAHDEDARLRAAIKKGGLIKTNTTSNGQHVNPLYNDLRGLRREMRELWSLCYMTPTDRGRAQVKPAEVDPLDEWAAS